MIVTVITLVVLLPAAIISVKLFRASINPISVFAAAWLGMIILLELHLLPYDNVRIITWLVVWGSITAFILGAFVVLSMLKSWGYVLPLKSRTGGPLRSIDPSKLNGFILVLFLCGMSFLAIYLVEIQRRYGLDVFLTSPWVLRADLGLGEVPLGFHYFYFLEPCAVLAFLSFTKYTRGIGRLFLVSLFVVCSLSLVLTTGRSNIFQVFIWCAIFCIYSDLDWFNAKRIAKAVIVIMTLFFLVFFVLGNLVGKSTENSGLEPYWRLPGMSSILTLPYIYISGNIPALDKLISNTLTFSFGQYTFLPFLKLLNKVGFPIVPHSGINEFYEIPFIFNTATYLDVMYMDFGIIGILVIPLLIGFTTTHLFVKMMLNPSFTLVYINSLTTMALLFSFGSSSYIQPSFWFYLLIGPIVGRLVTSRP